jgi:hypothetical protein
MKVTGPGSGTPPGATDEAGGADAASGGVAGADGKVFADRLDGATAPDAVKGAAPASGELSADGAALKAGAMSADVALDRAIGRILDKQIGPGAPPAVRAQIEAALREAVASDPLLIDKIKVLSTSG